MRLKRFLLGKTCADRACLTVSQGPDVTQVSQQPAPMLRMNAETFPAIADVALLSVRRVLLMQLPHRNLSISADLCCAVTGAGQHQEV